MVVPSLEGKKERKEKEERGRRGEKEREREIKNLSDFPPHIFLSESEGKVSQKFLRQHRNFSTVKTLHVTPRQVLLIGRNM